MLREKGAFVTLRPCCKQELNSQISRKKQHTKEDEFVISPSFFLYTSRFQHWKFFAAAWNWIRTQDDRNCVAGRNLFETKVCCCRLLFLLSFFLHVDIWAWLELDFFCSTEMNVLCFFFYLFRWLHFCCFFLLRLSRIKTYINSRFASSARLLYLWYRLTKMWKYYSDFNDNECFIVRFPWNLSCEHWTPRIATVKK